MGEKIILAISLIVVLLIVAITFDDAFAAKGGNAKVTICHILPGNPDNAHTITMSEKSVPSHLAHGDILGECVEDTTPPLAPTLLTPLDGAVIDKSEDTTPPLAPTLLTPLDGAVIDKSEDTTIHFLSQLDDEVIISSYPLEVSDFEAPTLGLDDRGNRLVDNGFSYNGNSIDVEWYFTSYPLVTVQTGKQNVAEFKIYDNHGPDFISHFELAFGLAGGESIGMSKAVIKWDKSFDGIETVTLVDPENVLDKIKVTTSEGSCSYELQQKCLIVKVVHTFRAPLEFNILGTNVWDIKRNAWQNYFNHGIEIVGESLNPPKEYDGINKGQIYHLTETGKNTAVDEFGNSWSLKYDQWTMDYIANKKIIDGIEQDGINRNNAWFNFYKYGQELVAKEVLEKICASCSDEEFAEINDVFSYEFPKQTDKLLDSEIQKKMLQESKIAENTLQQIFDSLYKNHYY